MMNAERAKRNQRIASLLIEYIHGSAWRSAGSRTRMDQLINGSFMRSMPPALVKAHAKLDRAVDRCYRPQVFENDRQRVEFLFALYEKLSAPLIPAEKKTRRKKS